MSLYAEINSHVTVTSFMKTEGIRLYTHTYKQPKADLEVLF